jgi:hypothetical protein
MQSHPAANVFPMLSDERHAALVADIRANGLRIPITVQDGMILDGRNRYKACQELGITPATTEYVGNPWAYVWSLNGTRRDLTDGQRAAIWLKVEAQSAEYKAREAARRAAIEEERRAKISEAVKGMPYAPSGGQRIEKDLVPKEQDPSLVFRAPSREAAASEAHVHPSTLAKVQALPEDLREAVASGDKTLSDAMREKKRAHKIETLASARAEITDSMREDLSSVCDIRNCTCAELFASGIRPDAVITDPPYPREFLPVFTELAEGCKRAGVPLVAVMSGQSYLPEVYARMCEHLEYRWTIAYLTPGGQAVQQWQAKVNTAWKPVLLFGEAIEWFGDVAKSNPNDNDKRYHGWGQSESGMSDLIERLTKPGQLVCDPFLGGGTTALAALALGRKFIGCDIDEDSVITAYARIAKMI